MFNGSNIYKNFCDAPNILFSFVQKKDLANIYKDKKFTNIYYRDCAPHYPIDSFYKRYNSSVTKNFDYKCVKKKNNSYSLKKFLIENRILDLPKKDNLFYKIHDMSLHDSKFVYKGGKNAHLRAFKIASQNVEKNLKGKNLTSILKIIGKNNNFNNFLIKFADRGINF